MQTKPRTVYTFRDDGDSYPMLTLIQTTAATGHGQPARVRHRSIFLSTYNRFIRLANSGRYQVWINEGDKISWEMWVVR